MQEELLPFLRCPVTRSFLRLQIISTAKKNYNGRETDIINEGILWADEDWFYPVINGIPRLLVESFIDYETFLQQHVPDYFFRKTNMQKKYAALINDVIKKNKRTKESFAKEWEFFNYDADKTWNADKTGMLDRFLQETDETIDTLKNKLIFDAGCGNGLLNGLIAAKGAIILGMDFSVSIEKAFERDTEKNALFIQGDVEFPPVAFNYFDIVHCSGVLIHTKNTEQSFSKIDPCVKRNGKMSVWLYHPRKNFIHNFFNKIRKTTSKLPLKMQYYLYSVTLFPVSFIIKKIKGNKQNKREMMIDIFDWFSPQFRNEHEHDEAAEWFAKRNYSNVKVTTDELFGFNTIGIKNK
jgi:2-polyprenyl-3-methyl-5-hydroxy-6-metoxy-1,4-benzoquinol methylase/uncharacterized protein YbaR (Trm112 family)